MSVCRLLPASLRLLQDSITAKCFMIISVAGVRIGRVVIGLHGNAVPKTCENFRCLCTGLHRRHFSHQSFRSTQPISVSPCSSTGSLGEKGSVKLSNKKKAPLMRLHYKGCAFHRIVPGFICQGKTVLDGDRVALLSVACNWI